MARFRDHRVLLVAGTLRVVPGMDVDVGYHRQLALAAQAPDLSEQASIELNEAVRKAGRIDIVIEQELPDAAVTACLIAEKEGAGFLSAIGAASQLVDPAIPGLKVANELRLAPEQHLPDRLK